MRKITFNGHGTVSMESLELALERDQTTAETLMDLVSRRYASVAKIGEQARELSTQLKGATLATQPLTNRAFSAINFEGGHSARDVISSLNALNKNLQYWAKDNIAVLEEVATVLAPGLEMSASPNDAHRYINQATKVLMSKLKGFDKGPNGTLVQPAIGGSSITIEHTDIYPNAVDRAQASVNIRDTLRVNVVSERGSDTMDPPTEQEAAAILKLVDEISRNSGALVDKIDDIASNAKSIPGYFRKSGLKNALVLILLLVVLGGPGVLTGILSIRFFLFSGWRWDALKFGANLSKIPKHTLTQAVEITGAAVKYVRQSIE